MNQKKVYLFTTLSLTGGGTERVAAVLSGKMADLGYETHIIVYRRADKEYPISERLKVHYLEEKWTSTNPLGRLQRNVNALRALLKTIQPDVILNLVGDTSLLQMYLASRGSKATFVASVRNHPKKAYKDMRLGWLKNQIHLALVKQADVCFMQTKEQLDFFPKKVKAKSFVLPNPVDDSFLQTAYAQRERIRRIVTLGRLNQQKNHRLLIEAFAGICQKHPDMTDLELCIYGEGEEKQPLLDWIKQLGMEERVHLCGRTTNPSETLSQYDLFVLSSDYEGMPNALMEAMAVGIPCISTDCPTGPSDMIQHKENGLLVPMRDAAALANAMEFVISDTTNAYRMGMAGKQYIYEQYRPEMIAQRLTGLIEECKQGDNNNE